jgi:hypothetical protein
MSPIHLVIVQNKCPFHFELLYIKLTNYYISMWDMHPPYESALVNSMEIINSMATVAMSIKLVLRHMM